MLRGTIIKNARMAIRVTDTLSGWKLAVLLGACVLTIAGLMALEGYLGRDIQLGGLYLLPLIVAAAYLPRWATFLLAIATALVREAFGPFGLSDRRAATVGADRRGLYRRRAVCRGVCS